MDMNEQDPSMMAGAGAAPGEADGGGFSIEIEVAGDGSITVSSESSSAEGAESSGGAEPQEQGTPAKDIKDALRLALGIYQNNGQMPQAGPGAEQTAAADAFGAARAGR